MEAWSVGTWMIPYLDSFKSQHVQLVPVTNSSYDVSEDLMKESKIIYSYDVARSSGAQKYWSGEGSAVPFMRYNDLFFRSEHVDRCRFWFVFALNCLVTVSFFRSWSPLLAYVAFHYWMRRKDSCFDFPTHVFRSFLGANLTRNCIWSSCHVWRSQLNSICIHHGPRLIRWGEVWIPSSIRWASRWDNYLLLSCSLMEAVNDRSSIEYWFVLIPFQCVRWLETSKEDAWRTDSLAWGLASQKYCFQASSAETSPSGRVMWALGTRHHLPSAGVCAAGNTIGPSDLGEAAKSQNELEGERDSLMLWFASLPCMRFSIVNSLMIVPGLLLSNVVWCNERTSMNIWEN